MLILRDTSPPPKKTKTKQKQKKKKKKDRNQFKNTYGLFKKKIPTRLLGKSI
jgi:hypothetical protein